jgi:hypothetical protein
MSDSANGKSTDGHITHDSAYNTVEPNDFRAMIDVDRYETRSNVFDDIISATHDHFWDPYDPAYLDFTQKFDLEQEYLISPDRFVELRSAVADKLDEKQKIRLVNDNVRWSLSQILHGEQGALSLSASLCDILYDPGAQEYAANQAREEARHVAAFGRYIGLRWAKPYPVGEALGDLINELVVTPIVYKKLVGMQMLIEGLAMGAFAHTHAHTRDPLLKRLVQLVMTDEAFHHKFGKIWADRTMPKLSPTEHDIVEDWAAHCFETMLFNLNSIRQRKMLYDAMGLDWQWVRDAVREVYGDAGRRQDTKDKANIFNVLARTLWKAGIITDRTKHVYAAWVNIDGFVAEGDYMVGDVVAAEGIEMLREINRGRRKIGQKVA